MAKVRLQPVRLHDEETVTKGTVTFLADRSTISTRKLRDTGEMFVEMTIARAGVMYYKASELGDVAKHLPGDKICSVLTRPQTLADAAESCRSLPITIGHPAKDVDIHNNKDLQKGFLEGIPVLDGSHLAASGCLNSADAIRLVDAGVDQTSLGHDADLEVCTTGEAEFEKIAIRANHVAIVRRGRAQTTRIGDSGEEIEVVDKTVLDEVTASRDGLQSKVDTLTQKLADVESARLTDAQIETMVGERVATRFELIGNVARLGDEYAKMDFKGQTDMQVLRTVVAKLMDADVSGKSDAYVQARFEVALEDCDSVTLGDALNQSMVHMSNQAAQEVKKSPRDEALERRKERDNSK